MLKRCSAGRARGYALLEALIAVVVLAMGVLAMASVEASILSTQRAVKMRQYAMIMADDLFDRARANRIGLSYYTFDGSSMPSASGCGASADNPCAPDQMAAEDLADWLNRALALGFSDVVVWTAPDSTGAMAVIVQMTWSDNVTDASQLQLWTSIAP